MRLLRFPLFLALLLACTFVCLPHSRADAPSARYYLFSEPVDTSAALGRFSRLAHPAFVGAGAVFKTSLLYAGTGEPLATAALLAFETAKIPVYLAGNSLIELKIRQWWQRRKLLLEVARIPGVRRVVVLTAGNVRFAGPLAEFSSSKAYVFVEATHPPRLTTGEAARLGAAVPLDSVSETRLRLRFMIHGETHPVSWEASLTDIFDRKAMPAAIARAWTDQLKAAGQDHGAWKRLVTRPHEHTMRIQAELVLPSGETRDLGTMIEGKAVRKLLGVGLVNKGLAAVSAFFRRQPMPKAGALPVCERLLTLL